jgi:hypothetical protein
MVPGPRKPAHGCGNLQPGEKMLRQFPSAVPARRMLLFI